MCPATQSSAKGPLPVPSAACHGWLDPLGLCLPSSEVPGRCKVHQSRVIESGRVILLVWAGCRNPPGNVTEGATCESQPPGGLARRQTIEGCGLCWWARVIPSIGCPLDRMPRRAARQMVGAALCLENIGLEASETHGLRGSHTVHVLSEPEDVANYNVVGARLAWDDDGEFNSSDQCSCSIQVHAPWVPGGVGPYGVLGGGGG